MKKNNSEKYIPDSFHLQWHLTERCNLKCKHCYIEDKFIKNEVKIDKVKEIINDYVKISKEWGLKKENNRISLTGGEPFLRADLFSILNECYNNREHFSYGLLTNGIFLTEENVKKIKELGVSYVQVSLEGIEATNDKIRGEGTFKKIVSGIERAVKAGFHNSISMTVTKNNVKEIPLMVDLAKSLGVKILGIRRLIPMGSGEVFKKLILSPKEVKEMYEYVLKNNSQNDVRITIGCEDGILSQDMHYYPNGCTCGYCSLTVLPNCDVYPCRRLPILVGNLNNSSLKDIFDNSSKLREIRDSNNMNSECQACPFFNECLGGAKCVSYAYFKKINAPDPQCWRLFNENPDPKIKWKSLKK